MSYKEKALNYHEQGYNCAQSVLAANTEDADVDNAALMAISAGFGGGARSGELCGAISGAIMAAGLAFKGEDKRKIGAVASKLVNAAKEQYGCVRCLDLKANGVTCPEIIGYMADKANELINDNK